MLESIGGSYALSSILLTAVELNVFNCLVDAPKTCEQIATEIQVSLDGLERLTIALTAMGLLQRDSMGNYHNTRVATTWLTTKSPQSMTSSLLFHKRCYDLFGNLTEVIKSGKHWGVNERIQILDRAHNLLKPGGLLLVSETLFDETKTGPLQPAILSLCMLLAMQGNNFTPSEIESILDKAGFVEIRFCFKNETGVRDLIVAQKPL